MMQSHTLSCSSTRQGGGSLLSPELQTDLVYLYKPYTSTSIIADLDSEGDDDTDAELDRYLRVRPVLPARCPNPIRWWLDRKADYPNPSRMQSTV